MIPTLAMPNIQVAPPVDTSVFTAPSPEPALGRLPLNVVPPPVTNPKVADNSRNSQPAPRNNQNAANAASDKPAFSFAAANGEMAFESPYSTTFVAQLFGQFTMAEGSGMNDGFLDFEQLASMNFVKYKPSLAFRPREDAPAAPVESPQPAPDPVPEAPASAVAEPDPLQMMMRAVFGSDISADIPPPAEAAVEADAPETPVPNVEVGMSPSLFVSGPQAYGATQSRNQLALVAPSINRSAAGEISLVM